MVDIFEEVEEQLRSARYRTLALRALPWLGAVLAAALLVVLGYWGWDSFRSKGDATASEAYAEATTTLQGGDAAKAFTQFGAVAEGRSKAYRSLALMQQGAIRLGENRTADAVALFDDAAEAATSPLIGDAARLQAVYALMDSGGSAVEIEGRLKNLTEADRPYRLQAREAQAMNKLANGQGAAARDDFAVLANGLDTPAGIRQRAGLAQALIDSGQSATVPALLKAARALPEGAGALSGLASAPAPAAASASAPTAAGTGQ